MILALGDKGGIVVFESLSCVEVILGFLARTDTQPEVLFSGLSEDDLIQNYNKLYTTLSSIYRFLVEQGY